MIVARPRRSRLEAFESLLEYGFHWPARQLGWRANSCHLEQALFRGEEAHLDFSTADDRPLAPHRFRLHLHPDDARRLGRLADPKELATRVRDFADLRDHRLRQHPSVAILPDPRVRLGQTYVEADFGEADDPWYLDLVTATQVDTTAEPVTTPPQPIATAIVERAGVQNSRRQHRSLSTSMTRVGLGAMLAGGLLMGSPILASYHPAITSDLPSPGQPGAGGQPAAGATNVADDVRATPAGSAGPSPSATLDPAAQPPSASTKPQTAEPSAAPVPSPTAEVTLRCDFTGPAIVGAGHVSASGVVKVSVPRCATLLVTSGSITVRSVPRCGGVGDQICVATWTATSGRRAVVVGDAGNTYWALASGEPGAIAAFNAASYWGPDNCGGGCAVGTVVPFVDGKALPAYQLMP
jgi:hypothetical protein